MNVADTQQRHARILPVVRLRKRPKTQTISVLDEPVPLDAGRAIVPAGKGWCFSGVGTAAVKFAKTGSAASYVYGKVVLINESGLGVAPARRL